MLVLSGESVPILYVGQPEHIRAPFKVQFGGSGHIAQIACGHEFNVVLTGKSHPVPHYHQSILINITEEGKVWTWGRAKCGCLGNGSEEDHRSIPMIVKALEHVKIENISCGIRHTAAWNCMRGG
jgi:alpha-tubulin suppressor-like RCC1 family protein